MIYALYLFAQPLAAGWAALEFVYPSEEKTGLAKLLLRGCAAWGLGCGIFALLCFCWLLSFPGWMRLYPVFEAAATAALCAAWLAFGRQTPAFERSEPSNNIIFRILSLALTVEILCALAIFAHAVIVSPHAGFDTWAFWNLRAKIIYAAPADWLRLFADINWLPNHNNPLFLPLLTARSWTVGGGFSPAAPCAAGLLFLAGSAAALYAALSRLKNTETGLIGVIILLGNTRFSWLAAGQLADIPLAFFMLVSSAFLAAGNEDSPRAALAAGIFAGLAAWTKTEGAVFLFCAGTALILAAAVFKGRGRLALFAAGAAPFLAAAAVCNICCRSGGALNYFQPLPASELVWRIRTMLGAALAYAASVNCAVISSALLLVLIPVLGFPAEKAARRSIFIAGCLLCLLLAAYGAACVVTPGDIRTIVIRDSLQRLFAQLWPLAVFAFLLTLPTDIFRQSNQA
ncbi:MAG: glycosyltransferase family 39 protein [Elusimicrobiales bacterium]|nr:glycosyltransferase family 39 protein [Elusimicrobiales bacterium]